MIARIRSFQQAIVGRARTRLAAIELGLFVLGLCLLAAVFAAVRPLPEAPFGGSRVGMLVVAAVAGLVLRGARRTLFYGREMSLHQSFAFEVVVQCVQFLSPLIHRRSFELEFALREAGVPAARANGWYDARALTFAVALPGGLAAVSFLYGLPVLGFVLLAAALTALVAGAALVCFRARCIGAVLLALVTFAVEGQLVVWAASGYADPRTLWMAYVFFTGLAEVSIVPGAVGVAEVPALGAGAAVFVVLVLFHAARLAILIPLGFLYLPRFKFSVADLYSAGLLGRMRETRQRAVGERTEPEEDAARPDYSIVIPAYNEARRLPAFLERIKAYVDAREQSFEVVVVDDGSKDETAEIVEAMARRDGRFRLLRQPRNSGKGAAVRRGVLNAAGRRVLFADADGATPIEELDRFMGVQAGADIVIGSRVIVSETVSRNRTWGRRFMGLVFYRVVNLLAVPGISDTQCGFKMMRRDVVRAIFPLMREDGWGLDVEMLYLAQRMGFVVIEVAVNWQAVEGSNVHPVRDSLRMMAALFRIRWRHAGHTTAEPASASL